MDFGHDMKLEIENLPKKKKAIIMVKKMKLFLGKIPLRRNRSDLICRYTKKIQTCHIILNKLIH